SQGGIFSDSVSVSDGTTKIILIPILLGVNKDGEQKTQACDERQGKEIFIYYSNSSNQTIAPYDLSSLIIPKNKYINPGVRFGQSGIKDEAGKLRNDFEPGGEDEVLIFDISSLPGKIYALDITPIRWQEEKNKIRIVSCANAKSNKILDLKLD
ncbi:MAG: hypothetical protein Q8O84_04305, partial [Nanoarchaeota archaeon]|nr:hypothetical protein [Nanoarchaeota archaeon]